MLIASQLDNGADGPPQQGECRLTATLLPHSTS